MPYDVGDELEQKFLEKINIDKFEDYKFKKFRIYAKYDGAEDVIVNITIVCMLVFMTHLKT